MPLILQKFIYRADLRANRHIYYVFGDNEAEVGFGGQAKEMRGEPNAIGVPTKRDCNTFWTDATLERNVEAMFFKLQTIQSLLIIGRTVILPLDGLGTGLSELPTRAPQTNVYLTSYLDILLEKYHQ